LLSKMTLLSDWTVIAFPVFKEMRFP
jgi:hypothetical protein